MGSSKRDGFLIGLFIFLIFAAAFSLRESFGGPNPLSVIVLFVFLFLVLSISLGSAKILLYRIWHKKNSTRGKILYFSSSAIELGSIVAIGAAFKFDSSIMFTLIVIYWLLGFLVNPLVLHFLYPDKHTNYKKELPFSLVQSLCLPTLGLLVFLVLLATY